MTRRHKPEVRKAQVLAAALVLANADHYQRLSRNQIAEAVGISGPSIQYHFKTMAKLKRDIVRAAIRQEDLGVIAQALIAKDDRALAAPEELKRRAMEAALQC